MTLDGTNGYVVDGGDGRWIAVDPGPDLPEHIDAFVRGAAERGARIEAIAITHGHPDHYPGAAPLARATRRARLRSRERAVPPRPQADGGRRADGRRRCA